jgi:PIN domain nuclease of toxin-antitoxin system
MEAGALSGFLLDTHVWIWALQQPERLNTRVRKLMEDPTAELYLSPVSIWEAHHLAQRRRLRYRGTFDEWLDAALRRTPLKEAPFTFAVGIEATRVQLPQSDFGDVLLAATASMFKYTLITSDPQLLAHASIKTLDAGR